MMDGYIKLYRKMLDSPVVMKSPEHLAVWIFLLLNATHKSMQTMFNGEQIELKPGQLVTGRKAIASTTKVDEYKVRRILTDLQNAQQINQQSTNKGSLISILSWETYQLNTQQSAQQTAQQVHSNCTASAQQVHTNKNDKNDNNNIIINARARARHTSGVPIQATEAYNFYPDTYPTMKQEHRDNLKAMRERIKAGIRDYERTFGEDDYDPMTAEVVAQEETTGERKWYTYQDTMEKRRKNEMQQKR